MHTKNHVDSRMTPWKSTWFFSLLRIVTTFHIIKGTAADFNRPNRFEAEAAIQALCPGIRLIRI